MKYVLGIDLGTSGTKTVLFSQDGQAVSSALSGFMIVFLLAVSGATDLTGALTGYSNNSLWLIVIGFIMAGFKMWNDHVERQKQLKGVEG